MSVKHDLRMGIRLALGLSTGLALVHGGAAVAEDSEDANAMEEVVVTGSRIKRTVNTVSQETITITAEDMDIAGDISVADALRTSNLNSLVPTVSLQEVLRNQMQLSTCAVLDRAER